MLAYPHLDEFTTLRTPAVELALDMVRCNGGSAHPQPGEPVSFIAFVVAVQLDRNPFEVQAEIEAYADEQDRVA